VERSNDAHNRTLCHCCAGRVREKVRGEGDCGRRAQTQDEGESDILILIALLQGG
jgi:hypothetical protein